MGAVTKRQLEIVNLMKNGYSMFIGISENTGRPYYMVTKDFHNVYFRRDTFSGMLENGLITQQLHTPFDYVLVNSQNNII